MSIHIDGHLEAELREALARREKLLCDCAAGKAGLNWTDRLGRSSDSIVAIVKVAVCAQEGES